MSVTLLRERAIIPQVRDPELRRMAEVATLLGDAKMGQASPPLDARKSQQLIDKANATSSASGTAVFSFDVVPQGSTWTGTITCPQAPATALFFANIGTDSWGQWAGDSIAGPVQAFGNQQLVVTATGLVPNTDYLLTWTGSSDPADLPAPVWPDPSTSAQTVQFGTGTLVYNQAGITGGFPITVPGIPSNTRTLVVQVTIPAFSTPPTIIIVGGTTNYEYYSFPAYLGGVTTFTTLTVVPFIGVADQSVQLTLSGGTTPYGVTIWADTSEYQENIFYNGPLYVTSQGVTNAGPVVFLTGPARLLFLELGGNASPATGVVFFNGTTEVIARIDTTANTNSPPLALTFPPDTILRSAQTLSVQGFTPGVLINATVGYTYP